MNNLDFANVNRVFEDPSVKRIETFSRWFLILCVFFAGFVFMVNIVYETAPVSGVSMQNTLNMYGDEMNDTVIVNIFMKYGIGDIVIVDRSTSNSKKDLHIKRIVGMPGDIIDIVQIDGNYYLERNGKIVEEKYIKSRAGMVRTYEKFQILKRNMAVQAYFNENEKLVIPENFVFVLGDNRGNSEDGSINGPYSMDSIIGKVQYVVPHGVSTFSYIMKNLFRLPKETDELYANV